MGESERRKLGSCSSLLRNQSHRSWRKVKRKGSGILLAREDTCSSRRGVEGRVERLHLGSRVDLLVQAEGLSRGEKLREELRDEDGGDAEDHGIRLLEECGASK